MKIMICCLCDPVYDQGLNAFFYKETGPPERAEHTGTRLLKIPE